MWSKMQVGLSVGKPSKPPALILEQLFFLCFTENRTFSVSPEKRSRSRKWGAILRGLMALKSKRSWKKGVLFCFLKRGGKCSKSWLLAKHWSNEAWKANGWHWSKSQAPSPSKSSELWLAPVEGELIPFSKAARTKVFTEKKRGEEI